MKSKYLIVSIILFGLTIYGCHKADRQAGNSTVAAAGVSEAKNDDAQQKANTPSQIYAKQQVPVLCYHRIDPGRKGDYTVSPATFTAHMKILADSGYHSILPAQLYDYLVYNKNLPEKPFMITFDDSRVEHSVIAAPVMEKYGFRGTFFIMTITYNKKNYMTTDQIVKLANAGHTIGLHSWDHTMVIKYKDATDWQKEVAEPKKKLEKIVNRKVEYWAYPNGVFNHKGAVELSKYFKISFILADKRDSLQPLQTVRRMIVPECSPQSLLKSMHRTFTKKKVS